MQHLYLIDTVTHAFGEGSSRRGMLQGLTSLALADSLAGLGLEDVEARKCKKNRKKKRKGRGGGGGGGGGNDCPGTICDGQCVDLSTDPQNCGECGATCESGVPCIGGRCAVALGERGSGNFQFDGPRGLAFDADGFSTVADGNNERIARFATKGFFETFGGTGEGPGQFLRPRGVAVNAATGDIYVTDIQRHCIQRFSSAGVFEFTFGFFCTGVDQLNFPNGIAIDQQSGNVYVLNTGSNLIKELNANLFPLDDFPLVGGPGNFNSPLGIAVDGDRNLVVADTGNNRFVVLERDGAFIRAFGQAGSGNGELDTPAGVAVGRAGIFVVDQGNNRIQQFSAGGEFLATFGRAGTGIGEFDAPFGIAIEEDDDVISVADTGNNRVQLFLPADSPRPTAIAERSRSDSARRLPSRQTKRRSHR